ncbi:MAG: U-box domain-containing protein [Legionella sp.]|nr:U-box domain-containing protein [Legionella sp.]
MTNKSRPHALSNDINIHPSFCSARSGKELRHPMVHGNGISYEKSKQHLMFSSQVVLRPNVALMHAKKEWYAFQSNSLHSYYDALLEAPIITQDKKALTIKDFFPFGLICPLRGKIFKDPVITPAGDTYERAAIERWLRKHAKDPFTNLALAKDQLIPNRNLAEICNEVRPHFLLSRNNRAGLSQLHQVLKPIIGKRNFLYRFYNPFEWMHVVFKLTLLSLKLLALYLFIVEYRDPLQIQVHNKMIEDFHTSMIDYWRTAQTDIYNLGVILSTWAYVNCQNVNPLKLKSPEEKQSFAHCIPYSDSNRLDTCSPAWHYSLKHQNIYKLNALCKAAGEILCVQTAMHLNVTDDKSYIMMAQTYFSNRLKNIEENLPIVHAAWERDPDIKRLVKYNRSIVNTKNHLSLSPLIAFMMGHILHRATSEIGDHQIRVHAEASKFPHTHPVLDTKHHYFYKPQFKQSYSQRRDLFLLQFLLQHGACLMDVDGAGRNALFLAKTFKLTAMVRMLEAESEKRAQHNRLNIGLSHIGFFREMISRADVDKKQPAYDYEEEEIETEELLDDGSFDLMTADNN